MNEKIKRIISIMNNYVECNKNNKEADLYENQFMESIENLTNDELSMLKIEIDITLISELEKMLEPLTKRMTTEKEKIELLVKKMEIYKSFIEKIQIKQNENVKNKRIKLCRN